MDKTAHKTAIVIRSGDALGHSPLIFKILAILDLEIVIRPRQKSSAEDIESLFP